MCTLHIELGNKTSNYKKQLKTTCHYLYAIIVVFRKLKSITYFYLSVNLNA